MNNPITGTDAFHLATLIQIANNSKVQEFPLTGDWKELVAKATLILNRNERYGRVLRCGETV